MASVLIKRNARTYRKFARVFGFCLSFAGFSLLLYFTFPLLSWKIFNEPAFANQDMEAPIPKVTVLSSIKGLLAATTDSLSGVDYTDAANWYPSLTESSGESRTPSYTLSIKKLGIDSANVSTVDTNLKEHLVNFSGTAVPPEKGTAVIFGHSTLPQLFNPKDYKTIFATAHTLKVNDEVSVNVEGVSYRYRIYNIFITTPDDMSALSQKYDDSYLTIITCTPPGTIWKRLIIQARLVELE